MPFDQLVTIAENPQLRIPQREGWLRIRDHFQQQAPAGEVGIVLPVGCGKSGLIAITPYALGARRALVISPGTRIRGQLGNDLRANSATNFYERCGVFAANEVFPEAVVVESGRVNLDDIRHCDVAVANIQQIAGTENRWLDALEQNFFDLILVDEAHHNTAASWQQVKRRFPSARIVNFSATPTRADGAVMEGEIIYSFPVLRAIEAGYVKRLRAKMLRPSELRYVDRSDGQERIIGADEVRALGENDAEFRRGIVMSEETLGSIVDQSIAELRRLRQETGEQRLKIIASALNLDHCIQITEAFRARGLRAAYVHSREAQANERVFQQLENHEIDAIVQARMLGEGFDHPYLAVAMVGSIFANLSPFVQFVGRIMRAIEQNAPGHPLNQGVVVFHVGANVARRWNDFRQFSQADQDFFAELLPEAEEVAFTGNTAEREPGGGGLEPVEIIEERGVRAADMEPIGDPQAAALLQQLAEMGVTPDQAAQELRRLRTTRQDLREARRSALNDRAQNEAGGILGRLGISPGGRTLDPRRVLRNFAWVVADLNLQRRLLCCTRGHQRHIAALNDKGVVAGPEAKRAVEIGKANEQGPESIAAAGVQAVARYPIAKGEPQRLAMVIQAGIVGAAPRAFQDAHPAVGDHELETVRRCPESDQARRRRARMLIDVAVQLTERRGELRRDPRGKPGSDGRLLGGKPEAGPYRFIGRRPPFRPQEADAAGVRAYPLPATALYCGVERTKAVKPRPSRRLRRGQKAAAREKRHLDERAKLAHGEVGHPVRQAPPFRSEGEPIERREIKVRRHAGRSSAATGGAAMSAYQRRELPAGAARWRIMIFMKIEVSSDVMPAKAGASSGRKCDFRAVPFRSGDEISRAWPGDTPVVVQGEGGGALKSATALRAGFRVAGCVATTRRPAVSY